MLTLLVLELWPDEQRPAPRSTMRRKRSRKLPPADDDGAYGQVKQAIHSVFANELRTSIDGVAKTITHQATAGSTSAKVILDPTRKIAVVVPTLANGGEIGLGDLFGNLPSTSGAINNETLQTFATSIQTTMGNLALQIAKAAVLVSTPGAAAYLAEI
jgi:hypothetical protein